jgi:hypothetical protein
MRRFDTCILALLLCISYGYAADGEPEYRDALKTLEAAGSFAPLFPFRVKHGAPNNITNVQTWRGAWPAAGSGGFVRAEGDQFVDGRGPRHFTGTNICFSGCFPEHAQAEQVAADLSRFGINLVRLHYVHHQFPPGRQYATPDSFIEPVQLEKFDYLFSQLKQRGIYVYMQLNIARKFGKASGFENADRLPWYNNGIDNVEPRMIALQKKYIHDLLTHVNPYTKLAYKDEPAIAMLELANENSLVVNWYHGKLDNLPSPYAEQLLGLWNGWLRDRYGDTAKLRKAWGCRQDPLGAEMIPDGGFAQAPANETIYPAWGLQHDGTSKGTWEIAQMAGEGSMSRLIVDKVGKTPNMPQFFRRLSIEEGVQYNLSFRLRASRASSVSVRVSQDHDPWHRCGFATTLKATPEWQDFSYTFLATMTDPAVRLVFANFAEGVTVDIRQVSCRPGGVIGLTADETLESGTVPLPKGSGPTRLHMAPIMADFGDFLFDQEDAYFQQMYRTAKLDVGVPQAVTGTQLGYGFWYPMARMDYSDVHAYWCHPGAPGGGSWTNPQMRDYWFEKNAPMVDEVPAKTPLGTLCTRRVVGRPYTVSEYDHAYPNFYAAEGNPMLFAVGAFQNWGAIMHFAWTHNDDYDPQAMSGYFDMKTNTVKQVHVPACYAMFTRGDVARGAAKYQYVPAITEPGERELHRENPTPDKYLATPSLMRMDRALGMAVFTGLALPDAVPAAAAETVKRLTAVSSWQDLPESFGSPDKGWIRNESGELSWHFGGEKSGYFMVDTPGTKVFTGFVRGRTFSFGGFSLQPGPTRLDWATVSLVKAQGATNDLDSLSRGRYLLAATGLIHNTGIALKETGKGYISTAKGYGGAPGTAPILCEGIPAELTFRTAGSVRVFALDESGERRAEVPVSGAEEGSKAMIGPAYRTVWYEVVIE